MTEEFNDEICQCEHSKGYHKAHALDIHGGQCEKCDCKLYTWKTFVFYGYKRGGSLNKDKRT